jgi:hypothetical protein
MSFCKEFFTVGVILHYSKEVLDILKVTEFNEVALCPSEFPCA